MARRDDEINAGLADLRRRIDSWEQMIVSSRSDGEFLSAWRQVSNEVRTATNSQIAEYLESEAGRRFYGCLAPYQRRYLALSELSEAESLLFASGEVDTPFHARVASAFGAQTFARLRELEQFGVEDRQHCVIVGCGSFPAAAMFFHDNTRAARITALEIDPKVANIAEKVVALHASNRLRVVFGDGSEYDYGSADLVYVVNQATPKDKILDRIASTAPPTARVILRDPFGLGRLFADSATPPPPWIVGRTGTPDDVFLSRHLVLDRHTTPFH